MALSDDSGGVILCFCVCVCVFIFPFYYNSICPNLEITVHF